MRDFPENDINDCTVDNMFDTLNPTYKSYKSVLATGCKPGIFPVIIRDNAQITTNHVTSLVANNVICILIGPPQ